MSVAYQLVSARLAVRPGAAPDSVPKAAASPWRWGNAGEQQGDRKAEVEGAAHHQAHG